MLKGRTVKRKLTQSMQERGIKMINIRKTRLMTKLAKCRIKCIEVFRIQFLLYQAEALTEPLVMHNLTLPQKADRVADIMVMHQP